MLHFQLIGIIGYLLLLFDDVMNLSWQYKWKKNILPVLLRNYLHCFVLYAALEKYVSQRRNRLRHNIH